MQRGEDMQMAASFRHGVIGITTLEKIVEQILSMSILDEKDLLKTHGQRDLNHFSMTMLNEDSRHIDMTDYRNQQSDDTPRIAGARFTQLFSQRLAEDVRSHVRELTSRHEEQERYKWTMSDPDLKEHLLP